jgi:hypothetical protein
MATIAVPAVAQSQWFWELEVIFGDLVDFGDLYKTPGTPSPKNMFLEGGGWRG